MSRTFTGREARLLLRRARLGSLGTLSQAGGAPYVSVANLATDQRGRPLIFVSRLAWHTQNLLADARASVLVADLPAEGDALTGARVTLLGRFVPSPDGADRDRYAARHSAARLYLDFPDFALWRLEPELVHAVAGFGRIETLPPEEVLLGEEPARSIAALAGSAVEHLNADHAAAVQLYAERLAGAPAGRWRVTSVDADGVLVEHEGDVRRIDFASPASDADSLRQAFAALSERARAA